MGASLPTNEYGLKINRFEFYDIVPEIDLCMAFDIILLSLSGGNDESFLSNEATSLKRHINCIRGRT